MIEVFEELDDCGVPTYGARITTAAGTVSVADFDTEDEAVEAVCEELRRLSVDFNDKCVFISGPITGICLRNVPNFTRVHAALKMLGARVVFDPAFNWLEFMGPDKEREYYMRQCMYALTNTKWDYIVMLDGWEDSKGSKLEHDVAAEIGIKIIYEEDVMQDVTASSLPF